MSLKISAEFVTHDGLHAMDTVDATVIENEYALEIPIWVQRVCSPTVECLSEIDSYKPPKVRTYELGVHARSNFNFWHPHDIPRYVETDPVE
jgi:hypothetical protein